ncbi:unnamed protein product [Adineta steineri]|uniref:Uncharacterized protein n=1 Tax=Adineta steineri TaxID=433720 RepID=A0A819FXZ5_9BILA|nr:unnamed protein product [Adineta steineri]
MCRKSNIMLIDAKDLLDSDTRTKMIEMSISQPIVHFILTQKIDLNIDNNHASCYWNNFPIKKRRTKNKIQDNIIKTNIKLSVVALASITIFEILQKSVDFDFLDYCNKEQFQQLIEDIIRNGKLM